MIEFKLPSMGSDMDEGKLLEWKVKPGDAIKKGDVVAVVDTTKAAVEVESWVDAVMHEQLVDVGETIPVGTVIAIFVAPGEALPPERGHAVTAKAVAKAAIATAVASSGATVAAPAAATAAAPVTARKAVSPAARARAKQLGVDVEKIAGTGAQGAVTIEDVEKVAAAPKTVDRAAEMRKSIAAAMSRSKREIPHYYLFETIPMARATAWLAAQNEKRPVTERVLMGALQLKAVARALAKAPELNGFYRDGAFAPSKEIHLGVAISIRGGGLIAPAIHDVDRKSLAEIMRDLFDLVARARAGSLRSSEMSDPTITVTNLGESGVESVQPVIYPPQVAIVGFGRIADRPWIADDSLVAIPAPLVTASLAADHRVSDGMRGARFLSELREQLQHPEDL